MVEIHHVKLNQAMNAMETQVFETSYEAMATQTQVKDEMMETSLLMMDEMLLAKSKLIMNVQDLQALAISSEVILSLMVQNSVMMGTLMTVMVETQTAKQNLDMDEMGLRAFDH